MSMHSAGHSNGSEVSAIGRDRTYLWLNENRVQIIWLYSMYSVAWM